MKARMPHPVALFPSALQAMQSLHAAIAPSGAPPATLRLAELRASQINGCSVCVDAHVRQMRQAGESEERLAAVAAWSHAPYFSEAERAALALAENLTRLADRADPVPEALWAELRRHFDEPGLAGLILSIAAINVWNRLNVATGQPAGVWKG